MKSSARSNGTSQLMVPAAMWQAPARRIASSNTNDTGAKSGKRLSSIALRQLGHHAMTTRPCGELLETAPGGDRLAGRAARLVVVPGALRRHGQHPEGGGVGEVLLKVSGSARGRRARRDARRRGASRRTRAARARDRRLRTRGRGVARPRRSGAAVPGRAGQRVAGALPASPSSRSLSACPGPSPSWRAQAADDRLAPARCPVGRLARGSRLSSTFSRARPVFAATSSGVSVSGISSISAAVTSFAGSPPASVSMLKAGYDYGCARPHPGLPHPSASSW